MNKKVNYNVEVFDNTSCTTDCPFGCGDNLKYKVGSHLCQKCHNFKGINKDEHYVICAKEN